MTELAQDTALGWIERWERQQEDLLPDREDRFTALIDAVELGTGREDPVVVDLGCGPGSLSVRQFCAGCRYHRGWGGGGVKDFGWPV